MKKQDNKQRMTNLNIRVPASMKEALEKHASIDKQTPSALARHILAVGLLGRQRGLTDAGRAEVLADMMGLTLEQFKKLSSDEVKEFFKMSYEQRVIKSAIYRVCL